jgi:pyruvate, water dikinase
VVTGLGDLDTVREGEILVCGITSPAWAPIFSKIAGTVTDIGGIMSHAAIVSREYGLPAVVGTGKATSRIKTGDLLRVNGTDGRVTILS